LGTIAHADLRHCVRPSRRSDFLARFVGIGYWILNDLADAPTRFEAKIWIYVAQALVFGGLAAFSVGLGPLFLFGIMKKADGTPGTDAGVALCMMSVPLLLISALAVFNVLARRRPPLRLYREGLEIVLIGNSSLAGIPLIPGLIRVAWKIISTEGFRQKLACIPWQCFQEAAVCGPPMARQLVIVASPLLLLDDQDIPAGSFLVEQIVLQEVEFKTPLDQIAEVINLTASASGPLSHLPSWHQARSIAE
jgi:hypothetical protein